MTDIAPFRALRYDPARVDLSRVLVPPYDVIAAHERARFYDRDPHNAIRLELTRDPGDEATTDYSEVAETLARWRGEGVLRPDAEPALYVLRQRFADPAGHSLTRVGFFGALRLEDYERRVVLPHERTLRGPKADRLKMLRATRANLSTVFMLYEDRESELARLLEGALSSPEAEARDDGGVELALASLRDPAALARITGFLAERPVVIADGHHRYETALAYRDECRAAGHGPDAPSERVLVYLANAFAPGTLLLPIHRVIRKGPAPTEAAWRERLPDWEQTRVEVSSAEGIAAALEAELAPLSGRPAFAADDGSGTLRIFSRPADGELSVRVVHREVIDGVFGLDEAAVADGAVAFPKSTAEAARSVREGDGAVAIYLNPLAPEDVFRVTGAGELLPQKSTFFHPKLPSGVVLRMFDEGA